MPVTPKERPIREVMKDLPQQDTWERQLSRFLDEATGLICDIRAFVAEFREREKTIQDLIDQHTNHGMCKLRPRSANG